MNDTELVHSPPVPLPADRVQLALLVVLFVIGAPINLISLSKLSRQRWRHKSHRLQLLKFHLNISDLMILFIYVASMICWGISFEWRGGDFLCKCIKFLNSTSFQLSSNIMVAIALDRLATVLRSKLCCFNRNRGGIQHARDFKIIRNLSTRKTHKTREQSCTSCSNSTFWRVRALIAVAWIAAIATNLLQFAVWKVHAPFADKPNWRQCVTIWTINFEKERLYHQINAYDNVGSNNFANRTTNDTQRENNSTNIAMDQDAFFISHFTYNVTQLIMVFWAPAAFLIVFYAFVLFYLYHLNLERKLNLNVLASDKSNNNTCTSSSIIELRISGENGEEMKKRTYRLDNNNRRQSKIENNTKKPNEDHRANDESRKGSRASLKQQIPLAIRNVRKSTLRTSMSLILAYLICWTPYNVMALWSFFDGPTYQQYGVSLKFLNVLIVLNSVINPFLYGTLKLPVSR